MTVDSLQIRRFEPRDSTAVWALHNRALEDAGAHVGNGPWDDDLRDPEAAYVRAGGEFLVGVFGPELVAMGALRATAGRVGEIKRMRVAPDHQRRGLGAQILHALERRARDLGFQRIHLDTTAQQVAAQRFYRKHGYCEIGRRALGAFELIFYEKVLDSKTSAG